MKNLFRILLPVLSFLLLTGSLQAQEATLKGQVRGVSDQEPLIGATVIVDNAGGFYTDDEGNFSTSLSPGTHTISIRYVGYVTLTEEIEMKGGELREVKFELEEESTELDIVVISGSQYEKKLGEETVSIDVIKPYLVENTNAVDLSEVTRKVPGVTIVDGQANIRGMSGYAYGSGSRVQLLVDDMPLLAGDIDDIKWEFVPIENVEQIEVIKGASSSLYGSSAMNGVINVRTGYARSKPETKVQVYQGFYSAPRRSATQWWDWNENPNQTGVFVSDRRRIGNLDLVSGANLHTANSYLQGSDETRGRINIKTRYKPKSIPGLSAGINLNYMAHKRGRFFFWTDKDAGAYIPFAGTSTRERYEFFTIDPHATYLTEKGQKHTFRGRYYNVTKMLRSQDNRLNSRIYRGEYQFQQTFKHDFTFTAGVVGQYRDVFSNLLAKDSTARVPTYFAAGYAQLEKKFKKLSLIAGARYELSVQPDFNAAENDTIPALYENTGVVLRAGANYQAGKATYIRASFGEAYRIPSLAERYIDESLAGLRIFPNPDLTPEYGYSAEVGVKQGLKISNWKGYVDFALFWADFFDMTEFRFVVIDNELGFRMQNISRARIAGMEISGMGSGNIGPVPVRFFGGYTFNFPADLESDPSQQNVGTFLGNLFTSIGGVDSLTNSILRYRFRHTAQVDVEADYKMFTGGFSVGYNTYIDRIDPIFETLIPGVKEWREANDGPTVVLNARLAWRATDKTTLSLICKNLSNQEYSFRPGLMEAPRSIMIQYRYKF